MDIISIIVTVVIVVNIRKIGKRFHIIVTFRGKYHEIDSTNESIIILCVHHELYYGVHKLEEFISNFILNPQAFLTQHSIINILMLSKSSQNSKSILKIAQNSKPHALIHLSASAINNLKC